MPKKILIVEDNEKNRILLKDLLAYSGYEVIEAENGEEGIKRAKEGKPDLILMDISMPVMNGFTALKKIRDDSELKDIIVIALTSSAMARDKEKVLKTGFDLYLTKPFNTRKLIEIVEDAFTKKLKRSI
jgi:two-component system cell cycle response regulator DivK